MAKPAAVTPTPVPALAPTLRSWSVIGGFRADVGVELADEDVMIGREDIVPLTKGLLLVTTFVTVLVVKLCVGVVVELVDVVAVLAREGTSSVMSK